MTRPLCLALVTLLLGASGCSFERRPGADGEEPGGETATPIRSTSGDGAGAGTSREGAESGEARSLLERFQEARRAGRISEARSLLHPRPVLLRGDRRLRPPAADAEVDALLRPPSPDGSGSGGAVRLVERLESDRALFVLRYPPDRPEGPAPIETVLLARDSAGWAVRLLQRTADPGE